MWLIILAILLWLNMHSVYFSHDISCLIFLSYQLTFTYMFIPEHLIQNGSCAIQLENTNPSESVCMCAKFSICMMT